MRFSGYIGCMEELCCLFKFASVLTEELQLMVTYQFSEIIVCLLQIIEGVFNYLAI